MTSPDSGAPEGGQTTDAPDDDAAQLALAAAAAAAAQEADDDDERFDETRAKAKIAKVNREAAALREQLKTLKPLADEAEKARKANQSESQRLTEEKSALEVQLAELRAAATRRDAAEAAGLPPKFVKFITAVDDAEALAQAKELAKELKAATGEDKKADFRQGARGNNSPGSGQSHDDLLRAMARGR